ncbi:MAG: rhodanese-like domain-containing protein [Chitinophagaceae bacterium]|nr:rhodanese-like domain-containing protein [Chitinophagaceae bacterium]
MISLLKTLFGKGIDYKDLVSKGAVIVDVRSKEEFRGGHIKNSINIPLDQVKSYMPEFRKMKKPIITVCRSGARSGIACGLLKSGGIENYNGGAWDSLNKKI